MKEVLYIFLGGGLGSVLRFLISKVLNTQAFHLPAGTMAVNIIGSLVIGLVLGISMKSDTFSNPQLLFLTVGFCGGFTTFSAFALENLAFLKNGDYVSFALYSLASLILGILAVFLGFWIAKTIQFS
ncbi:MAG: fluoride efflux transporter CrcB [Flavobacteriaceae bacterium]